MIYELKMEQFSGPISKLLELVEERKMEITEISLAAVTDDFLNYLKTLEKTEAPFLADFIMIASRLVFLKSKSLLPEITIPDDEEENIKDLELRLRIYKEIKPIMKLVDELWRRRGTELSRPYFLSHGMESFKDSFGGFYPGANVSAAVISQSLNSVLQSFGGLVFEQEVLRDKVVTIEEKIQEIVDYIQKAGNSAFGSLVGKKTRAEIIVVFLAILHLAREQRVQLEQNSSFSDIMVKKL